MSEINTTKINSAVGNAVDWLFNRARVTDNEHPCCGGLVNDYDMATGQWNIYESFWHTAQAVRALIALDKTSLPETAGMMAYLAKRIIDAPDDPAISGAICRVEGRRKGELATTTLTDGLPGVVDAYLTTGAPELRAALARSGNWLETCALDKATGFCYSFMDGKSGIPTLHPTYHGSDHPEFANKRPEAEGASLLLLGRLLERPVLEAAFKNILDYLASDQYPDGIWWNWSCNCRNPDLAHARYNLWHAHAMLDGFIAFGDEKYLLAARKTARFYQNAQQLDGVIPYAIAPDGKGIAQQICGSAVAMSALLWLRLLSIEYDASLAESVRRSAEFLLFTQFSMEFFDKNLRGAFFESSAVAPNCGYSLVKVRDIATIFGLQFFAKLSSAMKSAQVESLDALFAPKTPVCWQPWPAEALLRNTR